MFTTVASSIAFSAPTLSCRRGRLTDNLLGFGANVNVAKPKKGQSVAIFELGVVCLAVSYSCRFGAIFSFSWRLERV
ncbi:hypothetical protein ERO13_D09G176200v2 [Gossypium hirsutum]|uniref:Uncharacterized protein n=3 Tax=Gossypium TaxID=3633 RepID=A0A5J5QAU3_GOSBA|nr:hypothetical protein ES319_D09G196700v1 [Gossypium barbadense]KAG4130940.1 hypothetical protein ERO13_D09G176200v2 [Gossypium hirsutum]PPD71789.1 hypothetical protein GOBAR_DD31316 [Gossypium barbadense]TYG54735.1 hypothetical protein ES288_D09G214600v1 [Gossypium darwinii]TYH55025.1 hypothetical protein ES332_D09G210300v1 [Gossypium tomentosum]